MENYQAAIPFWLSYMDFQLGNGEELEQDDYAFLHSLYLAIEDFEKAEEVTREMLLMLSNPRDRGNLPALTSTKGGERLDEEYMPLEVVAPEYPSGAAARGIEGWVLVNFKVDSEGNVLDKTVKVVDAEPAKIFDRSSIRAAKRFKFEPQEIDGEGATIANVEYLFRYALSAK